MYSLSLDGEVVFQVINGDMLWMVFQSFAAARGGCLTQCEDSTPTGDTMAAAEVARNHPNCTTYIYEKCPDTGLRVNHVGTIQTILWAS